MKEHPGGAEFVPQHRKARDEKCVLHRHENLTAVREQRKDAIGFLVAVEMDDSRCAERVDLSLRAAKVDDQCDKALLIY